jgi:hypothetical protein
MGHVLGSQCPLNNHLEHREGGWRWRWLSLQAD